MGIFGRAMWVLRKADVLLEVLDARFPQQTRNKFIEKKCLGEGKKLLFVLNKSDLVSKRKAEKAKMELQGIAPAVFVSARNRTGINSLKAEIGKVSGNREVLIGVVGYPNTGKSSVINALKGRKAAGTSFTAGFTRGEQIVSLGKKHKLLDSPGIIPLREWDEFKLMLIGSRNAEQLRDLEGTALQLIKFIQEESPQALMERYGVEGAGDVEKVLEDIAFKRKKLLKGGIADLNAAARIIIIDWQKARVKL